MAIGLVYLRHDYMKLPTDICNNFFPKTMYSRIISFGQKISVTQGRKDFPS